MSGKVVEEPKDSLTCIVCKKLLQRPKILPCLHSACSKCLQAVLDSNKSKDRFPCPKCEEKTVIPIGGVDGFQDNVFLNGILGVLNSHEGKGKICDICSLRKKKNSATSKCLNCGDLLCIDCSNSHSATRQTINHKVADLESVVKGVHDKAIRQLNRIPCESHPDEMLIIYCYDCNFLVCHECQLSYHYSHHTVAVDEADTDQRQEIVTSIQFLDTKLRNLNEIEDGVHNTEATINEKEENILVHLENSTMQLIAQIETEKADVTQKVKEHMEKQRQICRDQLDLVQARKEKIQESCDFCNEVAQDGKNDEVIYLEPLILQRLHSLEHLPRLRDEITCQFPEVRLRNIFGNVETIRFFDFLPGPSNAVPLLPQENSDVSGVPQVSQLLMVKKINTFTNEDETCPKISSLASTEGFFLVGDNANRKIKKFNPTGKFLETLARVKSYSVSICEDTVICSDNFSISFFSPDYNRKVAMDGTSSTYPTCVYENMNFAVADSSLHEVYIFDKTGDVISSIGIPRAVRRTRRRNLAFICCNSKGEIIASDWGTNSVFLIAKNGQSLHEYQAKSESTRDWIPGGVCVDIHDNVFIADQQKGAITILSPRFKVILKHSTKKDYLERPMNIAYDSSGQILVAGKNGIVNIYSCKYL
ncbi:E3 ubiquitin-protein ligase TRIM56-like [Saccostrea echinata]|uniref:E3 ubiquitin-protein ligase TRIM56-like n=1 Tax=Saccostrea echinata TaxID=191078 RepID=UPI002A810522|nr:E3 ubiquitin-protein ligase TRIM56-like [Saccostrea echinata]